MKTNLFSPDEMMQTIQSEHNAVTKQFVLAGKAIFTVELDLLNNKRNGVLFVGVFLKRNCV